MELRPRAFVHAMRVRYGECDGQLVVFNARYGDYVDVAFTEFVRALGYGTDPLPEMQLVKQTTEWLAPSRYDEVLELSVATIALGNSSFTVRTEFRKQGDATLRARSETIYVHIDPVAWKKAPLTDRLRRELAEGPAHA